MTWDADLDQGILAVASRDLSEDDFPPKTAISWAESIQDDTIRSEALCNVLRNWVMMDLPAATSYFNSTTELLPADREQIADMISDLTPKTATMMNKPPVDHSDQLRVRCVSDSSPLAGAC